MEHRPQMKEAITEILLRNFVSLRAVIRNGIDSREFNHVDVELTIATLIGTINHLLLSGIMCRKMLRKSNSFNPYQSKKLKERITSHLQQLMRAHLLINNNHEQ